MFLIKNCITTYNPDFYVTYGRVVDIHENIAYEL